ncbi:MAG TPA: hypothetical protein VFW33_21600, partial [Gemmataceae bacterium]|nr:hypothetical protein [Gemmataceae bacterium]
AASGRRWPDALAALRQVLERYDDLDRSVLPLLLRSLVAVGEDGPAPFTDFEPVRDILARQSMRQAARVAAAAALGELHDADGAGVLRTVAGRDDDASSVRVAAVEALGALGRYLKARGRPTAEVADYLAGVLERRARERDSKVLQAAVAAAGPLIDPGRFAVLFDLLCEDAYGYAALGGLQARMADEADCRAVVRTYLEWRARKGKALVPSSLLHPDELFLGGGPWAIWVPDQRDVEKIMKQVAPALASGSLSEDEAVRRVAADLRQKLVKVPDAPPLDPRGDAAARAAGLCGWQCWWADNVGAVHLRGRVLSRD